MLLESMLSLVVVLTTVGSKDGTASEPVEGNWNRDADEDATKVDFLEVTGLIPLGLAEVLVVTSISTFNSNC